MQRPNSVQIIYLTCHGLNHWFEKKSFVDVQKPVIFHLVLSESDWSYPSQCFKSLQRFGVESQFSVGIGWNPLQTEAPKCLNPQKIAIKIKLYSNPILGHCKVIVHMLECWNNRCWFKSTFPFISSNHQYPIEKETSGDCSLF